MQIWSNKSPSPKLSSEVVPIGLLQLARADVQAWRVSARSHDPQSDELPHGQATPPIIFTMSNTELEQRCNTLRIDLKVWEKKFAATHQGRKAGRGDIKADVTICMHTSALMLRLFS
jgi:hypothetical protein